MLLIIGRRAGVFVRNTLRPSVLGLTECHSILAPDQARVKTVKNPDPDSFRPENQRSRTQNPQQMRPQPPVERGWADKADRRPPLRGPGGWGGDWYVWHAPDGPRARAATGLGCVQAGTQK